MTEATRTAPAVPAEDAEARARRGAAERDLLRDIAVGSLAGLIAGLVVGGVGGRVVMRLAALLAPEAVGRFTENGFRIGTITLQGSRRADPVRRASPSGPSSRRSGSSPGRGCRGPSAGGSWPACRSAWP